MGNCFRRCCDHEEGSDEQQFKPAQKPTQTPNKIPSRKTSGLRPPKGKRGVVILAQDLVTFEKSGEVPAGLSQYVKSTKVTQAKWYDKILTAWKEAPQPPASDAQAASLVVRSLKSHRVVDVQGLLLFYKLPVVSLQNFPPTQINTKISTDLPPGVQYELFTLPVDAKGVSDGDTITCFVDIEKNERERSAVPQGVVDDMKKRASARSIKDYVTGDALHKEIVSAGYRVFDGKDGEEDILAHKYRIRLRGIDAPENSMPFGQEAKEVLLSLVNGHSLRLLVYTTDRYGRTVADIYRGKMFIQEEMLKKGCAWHYKDYDKRESFSEWEAEARKARIGLWKMSNPEAPWTYRKNKRAG